MRQSKGFCMKKIAGVSYILPYGQKVADLQRGVEVNETGLFIWNALVEEHSRQWLQEEFLRKVDWDDDKEKNEIINDLNYFLDQMIQLGIFEEDHLPKEEMLWNYINIGGLILRLSGCKEAFSKEFENFSVDEALVTHVDLDIRIHSGRPESFENGTIIVRNKELVVCERSKDYLLFFPMANSIVEAHLSKDGSCGTFYCLPPYEEQLRCDLFHGIRLMYLYLAQKKGRFAIHSASILYKGKAWLFSGISGTGKSTHTNLWNELYDVHRINGDLNLLGWNDGKIIVYGMPWCGTSEISDVNSYPLGGVILLRQYPENKIVELPGDKKALHVMERMISPVWHEEQMLSNLAFAELVAEHVYVGRLLCTKEPEAAEVMKQKIDTIE